MPRAPRQCPAPNCDNRITNTRYCEDHTTHGWTGRSHATGAQHVQWARTVKTRDKTCQLRYTGCTGLADEADHIINVKQGGARYDLNNGQAACRRCHATKTRAEAQAGIRKSLSPKL